MPSCEDEPGKISNRGTLPAKLLYKSKRGPQYFSAFAGHFGGFTLGATWFWIATSLPELEKFQELGVISKSDRSWISSIHFLGSIITCPIVGFLMDKIGRRNTLMLLHLPVAGGCLIVGFAGSLHMIFVGRVLIGVGTGGFTQVVPIFVSECAEKGIRGMLGCLFEVMIGIGVLFIFTIGSYFSWRAQALICSVLPAIGILSLMLIPESPYFLMEKYKDKEAAESLRWLRGASSPLEIGEELEEISETVRKKKDQGEIGWRVLKDFSVSKPILVSLGIMTVFQGTFINAIMGASVEIFQSAGSINEYLSTIILGIMQIFAILFPMFTTDKFGRKGLMLTSLVFIAISLGSLGLYFYLKSTYGTSFVEDVYWVPLASLVLYTLASNGGIIPLTWCLVAEISPPKAKGLAASIVGLWNRTVGFVVLFIFWDLIETLGQHGTFWLIAAVNIGGAMYIAFLVPETKGKTLDEIQTHYMRNFVTKL